MTSRDAVAHHPERTSLLRGLVGTSRPLSWINTAYPFAAAYLLAGGDRWWLMAVATVFFLVPYNLAMYGINDVFDYESDLRNPRKEPIRPRLELTPERSLKPTLSRLWIEALIVWSDR